MPIVGTEISPMANMSYFNRRCWLEDCSRAAVKLAALVDEGFCGHVFFKRDRTFRIAETILRGACRMFDAGHWRSIIVSGTIRLKRNVVRISHPQRFF